MGGVVLSKYQVKIDSVDYTQYITNISVNHEVQTISPTFTINLSKNIALTGSPLFDIYMGYGNTLMPMLTGGTLSTYSRSLTEHGVEFVVNGRTICKNNR